jgi:alpha-mannosidase
VDQPIKEAGKLFAINTLPNYPRQAVVEVPLDIHSGLKTASAQLSKDGKKGMVLLDATDESKPILASPKGLYADVPRVTGMSVCSSASSEADTTVSQAGYNTFTMANGNIAMTIREGRIVSVYDKAHE